MSRSSSTPHPVADLDFVPQLGASRCSDREIKRNGDASSSIQQGMFCGETVPFLVRGMAEHWHERLTQAIVYPRVFSRDGKNFFKTSFADSQKTCFITFLTKLFSEKAKQKTFLTGFLFFKKSKTKNNFQNLNKRQFPPRGFKDQLSRPLGYQVSLVYVQHSVVQGIGYGPMV